MNMYTKYTKKSDWIVLFGISFHIINAISPEKRVVNDISHLCIRNENKKEDNTF